MIGCQKLALSAEPKWKIAWYAFSRLTAYAAAVPATRLQNPAYAVARFQNIAMMNVANSGALKIENSVWM